MPVLEEGRTMDYFTNHNMITMVMRIFKTLKMAAERGEYRGKGWFSYAADLPAT